MQCHLFGRRVPFDAQFILTMADFRGPASESQRVMQLQKRRERAQEEIEFKRKKLADELKLDKASRVSSLDLI